MKLTFDYFSRSQSVELIPAGKLFHARADAQSAEVEIENAEPGRLDLLIDGQHIVAFVSTEGPQHWVSIGGQTVLLTTSAGAARTTAGSDQMSSLAAPMPGQVRVVNVRVGETVSRGQTLMVLEAMKMEIRIQAPHSGRVKAVYIKQGQTVDREHILIELEEAQ
jgi:acetyl-CoA/propionyl-CoA carboxylase biotin carboxyl carrier protein